MAERTRWARRVPVVLAISMIIIGVGLVIFGTLSFTRNLHHGVAADVAHRENAAISVFERSRPLALAALAYRDAVIAGNRAARSTARANLERDIASMSKFLDTPAGRSLRSLHAWTDVQKSWTIARRAPMGWRAFSAVSRPLDAIANFVQNVGDTSGFNFEHSRATQSLADIAFNDLPGALMYPRHAMLVVAHLDKASSIPLATRIGFSQIADIIGASFSLQQDDIASTIASLRKTLPASSDRDITSFVRAANAFSLAGAALSHALGTVAMVPGMDSPTVAKVDRFSRAAIRASERLYDATLAMIRRDLRARTASSARARAGRYISMVGLVFLAIGALLLAWFLANSRGERALEEAQRERERLASELARQAAERALHLSEAQFRAVFDGSTMGIAILNREGEAIDANAVYRSVIDVQHHLLDGHESEFAEVMSGARDAFTVERRITGLSEEMWVDITISGVSDASGEHPFAMCTFADKTTIKQQERRLNFQRLHDALTGLPNRQAFEEQLAVRFDRARSEAGALFSVIFVDLEHFKDVNESLGHSGGDAVLRQISTRLRGSLNADDTVARLGSDEFAILVGTLGDVIHVESLARRLLENLSKPFLVEGRPVFLGASIGIAIGPEHYERGDEVLRDAEIAMQYAKTVGRERFAVFDADMQTAAAERVALAADLRFAVERREFRVLYQPVVDLRTGAIKGAEALLRWDHPTRGVISPLLFIPLAERGGFARSIGAFVLDTGCSQLAAWRRAGIDINNFTLHFNATPTELLEPGFDRTLSGAIDEYALKPSNLAIEITENSMLDDTDLAMERIERVRERGFAVCIDDFGTGYSSMRYMQHFKIDAIKIDKGFVAGANGEIASEPIVHTLVRLSEAFGVRVVAEGVETERQREVLIAAGCIDAQGFLFAEPLTAAEFRERLVAQAENLSSMAATGT
uniref:Uncharacterized protein n=1 Tax=mine drainage metagenome TaxID=410659 RepID=E6PDT9_9ZZZZ